MKKLLTSALLFASCAMAQQEPQFTQFWNALPYFNPATGAREYDHEAYVNVRDQWTKAYGNPSTQLLSYSTKLKGINSSVGGSYLHEDIGFTINHKAKFTYAYHLRLGRKSTLSLGVAAGVNYLKNSDEIIWLYPPSSSFYAPSYGFTADFGVAYTWRGLDVGVSLTQLPQTKYTNGYRDALHFFGYLGYDIQLSRLFKLRPQLFYKSDMNFQSLDLNMMAYYKNKIYTGVTFRNGDCWGFFAGWDIKERFRVSYAYDMWFSKLNNGIVGGTHEIGLGFLFKKPGFPKGARIISDPNF